MKSSVESLRRACGSKWIFGKIRGKNTDIAMAPHEKCGKKTLCREIYIYFILDNSAAKWHNEETEFSISCRRKAEEHRYGLVLISFLLVDWPDRFMATPKMSPIQMAPPDLSENGIPNNSQSRKDTSE